MGRICHSMWLIVPHQYVEDTVYFYNLLAVFMTSPLKHHSAYSIVPFNINFDVLYHIFNYVYNLISVFISYKNKNMAHSTSLLLSLVSNNDN